MSSKCTTFDHYQPQNVFSKVYLRYQANQFDPWPHVTEIGNYVPSLMTLFPQFRSFFSNFWRFFQRPSWYDHVILNKSEFGGKILRRLTREINLYLGIPRRNWNFDSKTLEIIRWLKYHFNEISFWQRFHYNKKKCSWNTWKWKRF